MADSQQVQPRPSSLVYVASFAALLGALDVGLILGYSSPAFGDMKETNDTSIFTAKDETEVTSLIGSSLGIGAAIGGISTQLVNNYLGRRWSLICFGLPMGLSWLLLALAEAKESMIIGRIVGGFCAGLICGLAPSYVVEISTPKIRGLLGTCFQVMITMGIFGQAAFVLFMSWRWMAGISLIPAFLMSILMFFMPETPQWLISKGRDDEAEQSLKRLRQDPATAEFNSLLQAKEILSGGQDITRNKTSIVQTITSERFYKPLLLSCCLMFFQQFSGVNAILFYQTQIYEKSVKSISPPVMTAIVNFAQVLATVGASFVVDKLGRRVLLCISGIGEAIALTIFGFHSIISAKYENSTDKEPQMVALMALISIIIFISSFSIGYGPIPWMMTPELTTAQHRSLIASIATFFNWTCVYIITQNVQSWIVYSRVATYWSFAVLCLSSAVFAITILPETKGKTTEEIQRELFGLRNIRSANQTENSEESKPMRTMA